MKKKFILLFLFAFLSFGILPSVNAEQECEYVISKNQKIKVVFDNDGSKVYTDFSNDDKGYMDFLSKVLFEGCPANIYLETNVDQNEVVLTDAPITKQALKLRKNNKVYCGSKQQGRVTGIPKKIPELTSSVFTIIQVLVPIILVVLGTLDLFKGITAGKEDEIKKGQQLFIKRLAVAAVVFFVVIIVKFFISIVADTNQTNIIDCIDCFISNDCEEDLSL